MASEKKRVDQLLVERGLCQSRSRAQALLMAGYVFSNDERIQKAGQQLSVDAPLELRGVERYVSRGGYKLEGALKAFMHLLEVKGSRCVDVGASTGGFTDCLLQHGAELVYAVDVGQGQLAASLMQDPRVIVRDQTNARFLDKTAFEGEISLIVVDASFIGIEKLAPALSKTLSAKGKLLAMIKPQFEVGRDIARKYQGVIRDPAIRAAAIERAKQHLVDNGFNILAECDSELPGPKGNRECFVLAELSPYNTSTHTS